MQIAIEIFEAVNMRVRSHAGAWERGKEYLSYRLKPGFWNYIPHDLSATADVATEKEQITFFLKVADTKKEQITLLIMIVAIKKL